MGNVRSEVKITSSVAQKTNSTPFLTKPDDLRCDPCLQLKQCEMSYPLNFNI